MELVGFENTQLTELFLASRPEGQPYLPPAVVALVERYKFSGFPTKLDELTGDRVSFRHGLFSGSAIDVFDIYRDGIVVGSKSPSDLLDAFVKDICAWMGPAIGLHRIETHPVKRNYESHLIVKSQAPLLKTLEAVAEIGDLVGQALKSANGLEVKFHPMGFGFIPDNTLIPGMKPATFRVERKAGMPFETNFYYSSAPLPTQSHLRILERLEKLS
jgi:hypothetical protein